MPPIPQFAKVLAKRAKAKPKVFIRTPVVKGKRRYMEKSGEVSIRPQKRMRCAETITAEEEDKKLLKSPIFEKPDDGSYDTIDLLRMEANKKLEGYRTGEKVKIYNLDDPLSYVEIVWPANTTIENVVFLTRKQVLNRKVKK